VSTPLVRRATPGDLPRLELIREFYDHEDPVWMSITR